MSKVRAAAVYAWISSDQDGRGLGVARQVEDCRKLAAERGWTVAEEYVDNDVSAYSGKTRPAYRRMLADLAAGDRDAVIVYNLDRLHRRPIELEEFAQLCERAGVTSVATVTADIDLGNDDGLFMARMFAAFAAKESGRRSARVRRKMQANAAAGLPHGGSFRPFGYDQTRMTVIEREAEIIRQLADRFLAGESLRSLAAWLEDSEVATVAGKPWRTTTLKTVLWSGRIAGLREHQGIIVGPAAWPAIISEEQHRRIRALMQQKSSSGRRAPRRYALSGLLRCGKCGNSLYSAARGERRRYVCLSGPDHGGCGRLTVVAEPVEELIAKAVLFRLDTPELADALTGRSRQDETLTAVTTGLVSDRAQLEELAAAYGDKQISLREWLQARKPIEDRISRAERQLARANDTDALPSLIGNGRELGRAWDSLNLDRQVAIIKARLDHAVIGPGQPGARSLDPARVQPVWKL
ncbi:MAG: recombinase family protein [Jatrophihabitantaceae bacterium]